MMPIDNIDDWEKRLDRQDAFWVCEIIDRPVVNITVPKRDPEHPWPLEKEYGSVRDRWMDAERVVDLAVATVANTHYLGDALPHIYPNLGPELFSAFFGCELEFGEETSWSLPNLHDWADVGAIKFSRDNIYWKKLLEMTDALLAAGEGRFYTGITDMHPGGDAITAFRDPHQLNIDMVETVDEVKKLLRYVTDVYFEVYDFYYDKLTAAGQAICTWAEVVSRKKWLVPSNDFSCMISPQMFDDVFLQSIVEECQHYEASLYHLDGPDSLRHLDSLLAIEELSAVQWVYGAGQGRASDWLPVYKKCQAAGKGLQIHLGLDEIDTFMRELRPEGLWLGIMGVTDREEGEDVIRTISQWA